MTAVAELILASSGAPLLLKERVHDLLIPLPWDAPFLLLRRRSTLLSTRKRTVWETREVPAGVPCPQAKRQRRLPGGS